jgi:hypothetical protein
VLDETRDRVQPTRQRRRIANEAEVGVQKRVAVVAELGSGRDPAGSELLHAACDEARREGQDLEREGPRAQAIDELRVVDYDDEALGHLCHDLLARVGTAAPLDQVELRVHLVRSVDRDVEPVQLVRLDHAEPELAGEGPGPLRRGDAADARPPLAERQDRVVDRRARAQSHAHAVAHVLGSPSARLLLQLLPAGHPPPAARPRARQGWSRARAIVPWAADRLPARGRACRARGQEIRRRGGHG